jgi:hypothetical protein
VFKRSPNKLQLKTRIRTNKYNRAEKIEFINFKFNKDKVSTTKISEEIAFYFVSRFHILKNLNIVKEEADKLFVNDEQVKISQYETLVEIFFDKDYKIILKQNLEKKSKICDDLEVLVLNKNEKLEELVKKCNQLEKQLNECKSSEIFKKLVEFEKEKKEAFKNYQAAIKKLDEFQDYFLKEKEGIKSENMQSNIKNKMHKIINETNSIKNIETKVLIF